MTAEACHALPGTGPRGCSRPGSTPTPSSTSHRVLPGLDDAQVRSVTVALAERAVGLPRLGVETARLFPALEGRRRRGRWPTSSRCSASPTGRRTTST